MRRSTTTRTQPAPSPTPTPGARDAEVAMRALANPEKARVLAGFFKTGPGEYGEGDRFLGVAVPATRRLARAFRTLPHDASLALLDSPFNEIRLLALLVLVDRFTRGAAEERAEVCRAYLDHRARVNNWNLVDSSAPYILGAHLLDTDPAPVPEPLPRLAASRSLWDRRIAVVATLQFIRADRHDATLSLCRALLKDPEDLMHKACGWMLREVGKRDTRALEGFLDRHAPSMPRTMLRYAIERFPEARRREYLGRA